MNGLHSRVATLLVPATALALLVAAAVALWADFDDAERAVASALLTSPRIGLLVLFALVVVGGLALLAHRLTAPAMRSARRIAESLRTMAHGNPEHRIDPGGPAELRDIAGAANELAAVRASLLADVRTTVADAKARVEEERRRLAALISELDQSVLVCNREGRILLYNAAAERLFSASDERGASEMLGLGRSVFGIIDRAVVVHALEAMERQIARDDHESTHFVTTTPHGRLLRVRAAPVGAMEQLDREAVELSGYVLLLADVTEDVEAELKRAASFQALVETTRAALANIRAAIENVTEHPEIDAAQRARFAAIIRDEAVGLSERLHGAAAEVTEGTRGRWPLQEMRGEDLLTLARRRIERRTGLATKVDTIDPALWLNVDSFPVAQALSYIAGRLKDEYQVRELGFRLAAAGAHAQLDVRWRGPPLSSETAFAWQREPFTLGGEDSRLTLADVMERHDGEAWYQREVPTQIGYFRLLLPLAALRAGARIRGPAASRPEFYDFDLFRRSSASAALDSRPLADLAYTVFDTETTGLDPGGGDEIIAIGAVRIVNGRVLQGEKFEALVDPQRSVAPASIAVHGITPDMLRGQPTIEQVLPRFRGFVEDSVLVGHNVAFDMRFLQRNEARTGVRFEQPVLDTLLLAAVVHPSQVSHGLDESCARLGVAVVGRHTALGDAQAAAALFLRLIPLLEARGIRTLGDARSASERTYYARLAY